MGLMRGKFNLGTWGEGAELYCEQLLDMEIRTDERIRKLVGFIVGLAS